MLPVADSESGECICKDGFRVIEVNKLGFRITNPAAPNTFMMQCEKCPANTYQGPGGIKSVWECAPCPDPVMVYNERYECSCPTGYLDAADGCISNAEYEDLRSSGFLKDGDELRVQYNKVYHLDDKPVSEVLADSDVFRYYYY